MPALAAGYELGLMSLGGESDLAERPSWGNL